MDLQSTPFGHFGTYPFGASVDIGSCSEPRKLRFSTQGLGYCAGIVSLVEACVSPLGDVLKRRDARFYARGARGVVPRIVLTAKRPSHYDPDHLIFYAAP